MATQSRPPRCAHEAVRTADLTNAVPVDDGRGRRTPLTLLHLSVRDHFLRAAADIHCTGMSDRQAAAWLHKKLARYRECAWQRDAPEECCPPRLRRTSHGLRKRDETSTDSHRAVVRGDKGLALLCTNCSVIAAAKDWQANVNIGAKRTT